MGGCDQAAKIKNWPNTKQSVWVSLMIPGELAQDSQRTKLQSSQFGEISDTCIWLIRGISCLSSNLKTLDENFVRLILKALVTGASQLLSLVRLSKHLSVCLSIIYYLKMAMLYYILVLVMMILGIINPDSMVINVRQNW